MLNVDLILGLNVCKVDPWKPDGSTPSKQEIWIVLKLDCAKQLSDNVFKKVCILNRFAILFRSGKRNIA